MAENVVELPEHFIGLTDRGRLESFGDYLIANGRAKHWYWHREHGVGVAFEIVYGTGDYDRVFSIKRDREKDAFYVTNVAGQKIDEGTLAYLMTVVNELADASA